MARRLLLELIADPDQFIRGMKRSAEATDRFGSDLKQLGLTAEQSARKQVEAATRRDARLRSEITAYRQLASAAERGSREQVAAANLAAEAERKLGRSLAVTSAEARTHARSVASSERELGRFGRGALAGSGAVRGLGRSLAFASGGFLAVASATGFLRSSIEAATQAAATERQLGAQFRAVGQDASYYRKQIEDTALATSRLSGFTRDDLVRAFTTAFRATRDVGKALTIMRVSADAARGSHKDLAAITLALTRAWGGAATSLRRLGILIPTTAKGMDAITFVARRFAGQAQAGATAQDRFAAALHNTQETVGTALLPTMNRYLGRASAWLGQAKNQERVQRDVNQTVKVAGGVVRGLTDAFRVAARVLRPLNNLLGGTRHTVTLLAVAFGVAKVRAGLLALGFRSTATAATAAAAATEADAAATVTAGNAAAVASGKVGLLSTRLGRLPTKIGISILIGTEIYGPAKKFFEQAFGATYPGQTGSEAVADRNAAIIQRLGLRRGDYRFENGRLVLTRQYRQRSRRYDPIEDARGQRGDMQAAAAPRPRLPLSFSYRFTRLEMRLAQAQLTSTQADDRKILMLQAALIRERIKQLASVRGTFKKRLELTQQLIGVESQITGIDQDAENKRDQARRKRVEAARKAAAAAKTAADREAAAAKKEQEAEKKRAEEARRAQQKRLEQARQAFSSALDTARSEIGTLFQGPVLAPPEAGPKPDPAKLLADIRAQTRQALRFERDLRKLRALGVGKATITELRGQGTAALPNLEAILGAPEDQRASLVRALVARQRAVQQIAQMNVSARVVNILGLRHLGQLGGGHGRLGRGAPWPATLGVSLVPGFKVELNIDGHHAGRLIVPPLHHRSKQRAHRRRGRHAGTTLGLA